MEDTEFSVPVTCVVNPLGTIGSTCSINTTADSLVPNYVKERKRTIIQAATVTVEDAGPNGNVTPPWGTCPPICGNGDEKVFERQGWSCPSWSQPTTVPQAHREAGFGRQNGGPTAPVSAAAEALSSPYLPRTEPSEAAKLRPSTGLLKGGASR